MYYRYLGSQPPAGIQEFYKQIITAGNELEMNIDIIRRELSEMGGRIRCICLRIRGL